MFPWSSFPTVKGLLGWYFEKVSGAKQWSFINTQGNCSEEVMKCLRMCEKEFAMSLPTTKHITSYSLRISCCSYLFASNVTAERIKLWIGWAINSAEWFRYVRHVELCDAVDKIWGSYIS